MTVSLFDAKLSNLPDQGRIAIDPLRVTLFVVFESGSGNGDRANAHPFDRTVFIDEVPVQKTASRILPDRLQSRVSGAAQGDPDPIRAFFGRCLVLVFFDAGDIPHDRHDVRERLKGNPGVSPYPSAVRFLADQVELIGRESCRNAYQCIVCPRQIVDLTKFLENPLATFGIPVARLDGTAEPVSHRGRALGIVAAPVVGVDFRVRAGHDEQRPIANLAYRKVTILLVRLAVNQIVFFRSQFPAQGVQRFFHHLRNLFVDLSLPDLNACVLVPVRPIRVCNTESCT